MRGLCAEEAAREAGYSGRPTYEARSLWAKCELLLEEPGPTVAELEVEAAALRLKLGRLKQQMQSTAEWIRAKRLTEE